MFKKTFQYIKFKRAFLIKSNERDYVINHYSNIVNQVDFKSEFQEYFSIFSMIYLACILTIESLKNLSVLSKGGMLQKNYSNLIFMNAYGELTRTRYIVYHHLV